LAALQSAGLHQQPVYTVCIEREFESWLFFDERMLTSVLSRETHPVRVKKQKQPHKMQNPKSAMMTLFQKHGHRYVDVQYARRLANALQDLARLRKCATFRRFVEKVTGHVVFS